MRYLKANLGDLVIGGLIATLFFSTMILGIGGIAHDNSMTLFLPVNNFYNSFKTNSINSVSAPQANALATAQTTANTLKTQGLLNQITNAFSTLNLISQFIFGTPAIFIGMINFIAEGAGMFLGVDPTLAVAIAWGIILLIIGLIILSALFIFPLLRGS
jgi:hypothetical protein